MTAAGNWWTNVTAEDWLMLIKRKITKIPEEEDDPEVVEPPQQTPIQTYVEEENPFKMDDGETAVTAAQDLHTTDPEKIKTLGNVANPKAFAFGHMFTYWEQLEGAEELAKLDEVFLMDLEKFQIGRAGKDNRAKLFADVLKADMAREFQERISGTADKALGRK